MLSRRASALAATIRSHDWSDAPYRADRAGHQRATDSKRGAKSLNARETALVRWNVVAVSAQALKYDEPTLDIHEFALACGVEPGMAYGAMDYGIRPDDIDLVHMWSEFGLIQSSD